MPQADHLLAVYLHLVRASQLRRQPLVCDQLLVLAGAVAAEMGLDQIAALCRQRILSNNPQHLVRNWPTFEDALADERFQTFLNQLRRRYAPERAEHMLQSLGIELGQERELYLTHHEYAAALLGETPESLGSALADPSQPAPAAAAVSADQSAKVSPRGNRLLRAAAEHWPLVLVVTLLASAGIAALVQLVR